MFAGSGHLFREEVVMSGVIPQVAALMGPCAAGTAYIPGLADFVPMVKGRGSMALAGPHLVRAAVGEDVTQEEPGRLARALSQVGRGRHGGGGRASSARGGSSSTSPTCPRNCEQAPPWILPCVRPDRQAARRSCWMCCRSPTASRMTCTR